MYTSSIKLGHLGDGGNPREAVFEGRSRSRLARVWLAACQLSPHCRHIPEFETSNPPPRQTMHWKRSLVGPGLALVSLLGTAQAQGKGEEPAVFMSTEVVATDGVAGYTTYQVKVTFGPKAADVYALVSDIRCFLSTPWWFVAMTVSVRL